MKLFQKIKKNLNYLSHIRNSNNIIYNYKDVPAIDHRVNIHIHDVKRSGFKYSDNGKYPKNLGDNLAIPICQYLLDKQSLRIDSPISGKKHLFTVGSGALNSFADATIWGSGILFDGLRGVWWEKYWDAEHRKLDIRAVRGPLSREVFLKLGHHCPEVYGDPGILMPMIYTPSSLPEKTEYCIIPQYVTESEVKRYFPEERIISMNTDDYKSTIDRICSCNIVYSSSLHGIILAESYGVPAIFYRGLKSLFDFKYRDYYASTGRYDIPMANTLVEAMRMTPPPLPDLRQMQHRLVETFPYDLWE